MTPTDEQLHILDQVKSTPDNLLINALAGTGKTSTLELIQSQVSCQTLYLAFNRKIAQEAEKRFPPSTTVRTFNSLGHRIWAKTCSKNLTLDPKKTQTQLREIINSSPKSVQGVIWDCFWEVIHGVALAKSLGYIPGGKFNGARRLIDKENFHASLDEVPDALVSDLIDQLLLQSIKAAYEGLIDFNDQIYMPALFGGTYPRFPLVAVDEAQDLSPTNHAMLDKLCKNRLIAVGDPFQSIYAFRGAEQNGMSRLGQRFKMTECDLSISFRCPKAIVLATRWRVPKFQWIKEGGYVDIMRSCSQEDLVDTATIICRNNAPLFRLAMSFLFAGRSVSVAGSDIGPKLVGILRKLSGEDIPRSAVLSAITSWLQAKQVKGSTTAEDMAACMRVFAEHGSTLGQAIRYAEHLFAQKGSIRLLTGHKAKGLEFDTVYHLDPWLIGEGEQELNLRYVITTRSADSLYEINSKDIRWP